MAKLDKPNFILVDFENTQMLDIQRLVEQPVRIVIFIGLKQNARIPVSMVRELLKFGDRVEFIESVVDGPNALDFQMAYYAGRIIERDPSAFIHFITKDQGFDAVVAKIKADKRGASRAECFESLPFMRSLFPVVKSAQKSGLNGIDEKKAAILARLSKMPSVSRPRKKSTLLSAIKGQTDLAIDDAGAEEIVCLLTAGSSITISDTGSITYLL